MKIQYIASLVFRIIIYHLIMELPLKFADTDLVYPELVFYKESNS